MCLVVEFFAWFYYWWCELLTGVWGAPGRWQCGVGTLERCGVHWEIGVVYEMGGSWWEPLERWWWKFLWPCAPAYIMDRKMVVASKGWNINIKLWCCHTCRWDNNSSCGLQPSFHQVLFWAVQWIPPVLQLPSETWYIFHELSRKRVFLVTDCMLKHWKMKAPNICFRKTQWKILSSSLLKLHQPEFH